MSHLINRSKRMQLYVQVILPSYIIHRLHPMNIPWIVHTLFTSFMVTSSIGYIPWRGCKNITLQSFNGINSKCLLPRSQLPTKERARRRRNMTCQCCIIRILRDSPWLVISDLTDIRSIKLHIPLQADMQPHLIPFRGVDMLSGSSIIVCKHIHHTSRTRVGYEDIGDNPIAGWESCLPVQWSGLTMRCICVCVM